MQSHACCVPRPTAARSERWLPAGRSRSAWPMTRVRWTHGSRKGKVTPLPSAAPSTTARSRSARLPPRMCARRGRVQPGSVLQAFLRWGEGALPRLRGTSSARSPTAARPGRSGISWASRSLFHRSNGHGFLVASEAEQVAAGAGIAREPDLEAVADTFYGRLDGARTAVRGVERFPRASLAIVTAGARATLPALLGSFGIARDEHGRPGGGARAVRGAPRAVGTPDGHWKGCARSEWRN